jgi:DNA-binding winged helix-turn-helix (wHTH) protein
LAYLVQRPGRTVTKEDLREQLWPHQPFMSDDPLTNCVAQARRAIGDSGHAQRCIQTVHGRGYRFIAPVDIRQRVAPDPGSPTAVETPRPAERPGLEQAAAVVPRVLVPREPPSAPRAAGPDLP